MISLFKMTHDWSRTSTGEGIKATEGLISFKEKIMSKCAYYYRLYPVLGERLNVAPLVTTDNVEDDSVAENEAEEAIDDGTSCCMSRVSSVNSMEIAVKRKFPANHAKSSLSNKKKALKPSGSRGSTASLSTIGDVAAKLGVSAVNDQYGELAKAKQRNDDQCLQLEREKFNMTQLNEKQKIDLEREKFNIQRVALMAEAHKAKLSAVMVTLEMRADAKNRFPDKTDDEIAEMFPHMD